MCWSNLSICHKGKNGLFVGFLLNHLFKVINILFEQASN